MDIYVLRFLIFILQYHLIVGMYPDKLACFCTLYTQVEVLHHQQRMEEMQCFIQNICISGYSLSQNLFAENLQDLGNIQDCHIDSSCQVESFSTSAFDFPTPGDDLIISNVDMIQQILKSHEDSGDLESALDRCLF